MKTDVIIIIIISMRAAVKHYDCSGAIITTHTSDILLPFQ